MTFIVNHENGVNTCSVNATNLSPFPATESQQTINNAFGSYSRTHRMNTFRERGIFMKNQILKSHRRFLLKITVDNKTL